MPVEIRRIGAGEWRKLRDLVLRLRVTVSNDAAVRLYVRCGFSDVGLRLPLREGSDVMTMSMTKDL